MATVVTSSTAYCTATRFLDAFDARAVADLVRDDNGPAPTRLALLDEDDTAGARVASALLTASGLVESACTHGKRYLPSELTALTGATKAHLERLVAALAFGLLMERRQPSAARRDQVPAIAEADKELERLRLGEHVFGLNENQEPAQRMDGLRPVDAPSTVRTNSVIVRGSRYFGERDY